MAQSTTLKYNGKNNSKPFRYFQLITNLHDIHVIASQIGGGSQNVDVRIYVAKFREFYQKITIRYSIDQL